jgi:uncharacterized C2H2 Zn-finger protein
MRSAIVQQHLALLCAAACTVHQSADTRRRSRPQCDLTSDSSRELLPPRRETPTFWNWIGQALSQPEISRRRDGDMEKIQQNADLTMAVLAPPRSRTDQENPRRFDSIAVARSGFVATLDRVPSCQNRFKQRASAIHHFNKSMVRDRFKKCVGQCSLPERDSSLWAMEVFRPWYCIVLTTPVIWRGSMRCR